jgi:hypothetical protein
MGYIEKVVASNNLLFIKDGNDKLFVFDSNGKFLNTIGEIGQGPDELLSFVDFYVNKEAKYVGIYDIHKSKMYRYAFDGTIIGKFDCDPILRDLNLNRIEGLNNGKLIISMGNDRNNDFNYIIMTEKDYSLYKKCLPYLAQSKGAIYESTGYSTVTYGKQTYATSFLSDTIYRFTGDDIIPTFVLQSSLKKASKDILDKHGPYQSAFDAYTFLKQNGYSIGIEEIFATDNYIYFSYQLDDVYTSYIFWNIAEKKGYYLPVPHRTFQNVFDSMAPIASSGDAFISVINAGQAIEAQQGQYPSQDPRVLELMKNVKEDDNPILVFYYTNND